jgi:hypothetical protein
MSPIASGLKRRLARNTAFVAGISAVGLVMQLGGAGGALAVGGVGGGVTVDLGSARAALADGSISADYYASVLASGALVLARPQPVTEVYLDPSTGEIVTDEYAVPSVSLLIPGAGTPVTGAFTRRIPGVFSPVDMVAVDATPVTGGVVSEGSAEPDGGVGGIPTVSIIRDPETVEPGTADPGALISETDGIVTTDTDDVAQAGGTDGSCNPSRDGLIQHPPQSVSKATQSYYYDYTMVPYEKPMAHSRPGGIPTYQIALCAFGNMKVINGNRLLMEGVGLTAWDGTGDGSVKRRIGQAYDTTVEDGTSSGEVNFSLDIGAASVGVTIGTTSVGRNLGAFGIPGPAKKRDPAAVWSLPNVVEAWWEHASSWQVPWWNRGSRDAQATINEGLYEFTYDVRSFWAGFAPYSSYRCTARNHCPTHTAA